MSSLVTDLRRTPYADPMAAVRVVTDSTASLGSGQADRAGIVVVPLQVVLDGVSAPEATDASGVVHVTGAEVAGALRAGRAVTTSRPSPETFAAVYRRLGEDGAAAVVSAHLSSAISGTYDAALAAARTAPVPVTVLDSRTVAMALGFAARTGATLAAAGAEADDVMRAIERRAAAAAAFFSVDSLEYLRRGGRIGTAQALLGSALAVKPLLTVTDGSVAPCERVRTRAKALTRLRELAVDAAAVRAAEGLVVDVAVHHLDDLDDATEFSDQLGEALRSARISVGELVVSPVSAVVGVHVGPGMLGVIVSPQVGAG